MLVLEVMVGDVMVVIGIVIEGEMLVPPSVFLMVRVPRFI